VRVEFLCGARAVRRAHADFDALSRVAQVFSSPLDDSPDLVRSQAEALRAAEKQRQKLEIELAVYRARELYDATTAGADGIRRVLRTGAASLDSLRPLAQSFCARPKAVFIGAVDDPPSVLLASSEDSGVDAGKTLKAALAAAGGRGGGSARMAQGSAPTREALARVLEAL
jgi:alanyl-tRNA synthetase